MDPIADREVLFEHDGATLFALERGRGRPFVFLHGGLADHRASLVRVGALATSCRLLLPDVRGSGRSIDARALGWDRLADDVAALLDHLAIDRAIVGGTSAGSAIALRFALRHPDRLLGLVLLAPVYAGGASGLCAAQERAFRAMADAGERALAEGIEALAPLYAALPEPIRARALAMMRTFDPASVAATTRFLASGAQPMGDVRELAAIEAPVLIVRGEDPEHPPELADLYARHLARCEVVDPGSADGSRIERFCRSL